MNWSISHRFCSEKSTRDSGFTLIEVLVAISLLTIVLTSIYGIFSAVSSAKERLDGDSADYQLARVLFDRLGRELRSYHPIDQLSFKGSGATDSLFSLEFTSRAVSPLAGEGAGIAMIRYWLEPDPQGDQKNWVLLRSETPLHGQVQAGAKAKALRLAGGIAEMDLRYYNSGQWFDSWEAQGGTLPELVEISLQLESEPGQSTLFRSAFDLAKLSSP